MLKTTISTRILVFTTAILGLSINGLILSIIGFVVSTGLAIPITSVISTAFTVPSVSAVSSSSQVNIDVVSGIAMRILDSNKDKEITGLDFDLTATPDGTYTSNSFNVEVSTSNKTGYKLYLATNSNSNDLVRIEESSFVIPTLSGSIDQSTFASGGTSGGVSGANRWGYSLDNATYSPIPEVGETNEINSSTTSIASDYTPVYIGMNINMEKASGTYTNQLLLSAIANPVPVGYSLEFNKNTTDTVTNLPTTISDTTTASSYTFTIPDTIPARSGYSFSGWYDQAIEDQINAGTLPEGSKGGISNPYLAGDEVTVIAEGWDDKVLTLYAIWGENNFWTISNMQEMTSTICNSVKTPSNATGANVNMVTLASDNAGDIPGAKATYAINNMAEYNALITNNGENDGENQPYVAQRILYDIRDSNSYIIRKLADGNCWMTENLKLALEADKIYKDWGSYNDGTTFDLVPVDSSSATSSWYPCSTNGACVFNGNTAYDDTTKQGYYSWYAATAGKGTSSSATDINGSICPKGWKLPYVYTVNNAKSYRKLVNDYLVMSYILLESAPLSFSRPGAYSNSKLYNNGTYGNGWSSTAHSNPRAYLLFYSTSAIYTQDTGNKHNGWSVRCVSI